MVGHHGKTGRHSGATHSCPGNLRITIANSPDIGDTCPEKCEMFHFIKSLETFSRNKTWRAVCSRDLAIKPWTEAECVVDLILGRAPQVSGKFLVYRAALEGSMAVAVVSSDTGTLGIHTPAQPPARPQAVLLSTATAARRGPAQGTSGLVFTLWHNSTIWKYLRKYVKIC